MAGNFENNIFKRSARKRWTLFRGTRGLFQRVGSEMAEDGCPDAQFRLANDLLLKQCDSSSEESENAREGVYWLIQASEQGHIKATQLLKQCLDTGKGITEHNISEVIECLETSRNEKLSVKAMKDLFMNFSDGEEFITSNQLLTTLKELEINGNKTKTLPQIEARKNLPEDWKNRTEHLNGHKLTEDVLVTAGKSYARGELPDIGHSLVLSELNICQVKSINTIFRILFFPFPSTLNRLYTLLLSFSPKIIFSLLYISPAHLKILLCLFVYNTFNFDNIINALPTIIYYLSFFVMIAATCQILQYRTRFRQFRCWSNLFLLYGGENLSSDEAEFLHCRNGLSSCVYFFVFLLVNLFIQSFATVKSFFHAEITFIAFLFTIVTLFSFTCTKSRYMSNINGIDYLGLFSLMLHILAKYPYETDSVVGVGWRFLDLQVPTFASYVVGHGIEFCLNFRAFFYLIIPAVLVKMAARHNWRGVYSDFIPHCVTLSWWQLTLIYAQDSTWYSLIRPALAIVGVVLFLPLTALATIFLPLYAIAEYLFQYEDLSTIVVTFILTVGLPLLMLRKIIYRNFLTSNGFTVLQVIMSLVAAIILLSQYDVMSNLKKSITETSYLGVSEFTSYCNSFQSSYSDRGLESQLTCSELLGLPVHWKGKVKHVRISKLSNPVVSLVNILPSVFSKYIHYLLGEEYSLCSSSFRVSFCKTLSDSYHLGNWNNYEFEIDVDIIDEQFSVPAMLIANNNFKNFTHKLNAEDTIWFFGTLVGDENGILNSLSPRILLSRVTCSSCLDSELSETTTNINISLLHVYNFIKYLMNFFFNPLIVFK